LFKPHTVVEVLTNACVLEMTTTFVKYEARKKKARICTAIKSCYSELNCWFEFRDFGTIISYKG